jgi:predicted nucleic acid-binding protein
MIDSGKFEVNLSVPLMLEYEAVALRMLGSTSLSARSVGDILDYICAVGRHCEIHYLWRPMLPDPKDDMILELAAAAQCGFIITFSQRDYRGVERFGIKAITPQAFLRKIGA